MDYNIRYNPETLKAARRLAKWTQKDLAQRSGVHAQAVGYWESKNKHGQINGVAVAGFATAFKEVGIDLSKVNPNPPFPAKCGAKNRRGQPCAMKPIHGKRRCKFHGGMSTGAKTQEGRERIAQAQKRRWAEYRKMQAKTNAGIAA